MNSVPPRRPKTDRITLKNKYSVSVSAEKYVNNLA
jgi:hypothetical protein